MSGSNAAMMLAQTPAAGGGGTIVFDATSGQQALSNVQTPSWSHTATGTNRYVVVAVGTAGANGCTCTATYGGVSMTNLGSAVNTTGYGSGVQGTAQLFGLINPPTGAQTVALTFSAAGNYGTGVSLSYTGVHQTVAAGSPFTNTGSAASASDTLTVTGGFTGERVVDIVALDASTSAPTGTQTSRANTGAAGYLAACQDAAGGSSVAMQWSWSPNGAFAHAAVNLKAA